MEAALQQQAAEGAALAAKQAALKATEREWANAREQEQRALERSR